jgi:hypothetical protein
MTGRRLGYCAGGNTPGSAVGFGYGRGRGYGYGHGYGYRRQGFAAPVPPVSDEGQIARNADEVSGLRAEVNELKNTLNTILQRLGSSDKEEER